MYECLGVALTEGTGSETVGDCPFCGKVDHFFVNALTGLYSCKVCGAEGNQIDFLGNYSQKLHLATSRHCFKTLARRRSTIGMNGEAVKVDPPLPWEIYQRAGMAWNPLLSEWWLPVKSHTGSTRDIRRWNPKASHPKFMSTDGCSLQLYGMDILSYRKDRDKVRIWICEGEHDAITLRYLMEECGEKDIVVGVPGAGTFKQDWMPYFQGCHVIVPYDNDKAGEDGSSKVGRMLKPITRKFEYICWPEVLSTGYDIRDFILQGRKDGTDPKRILQLLTGLLSPLHVREGGQASIVAQKAGDLQVERLHTVNWKGVVEAFKIHVKVDRNFLDGLAVSLATAASGHLTGEPIWLYLIAPPGGGKTLILASLKDCTQVIYESTITRTSLISGFDRGGVDNSLLPKLDKKCGVFKDGTAILSLHPDARRELYGTLRDAFDGETSRPFGNCHRHYVSHFNMLIGVTPAIHAENQSSTGERFLKFEMIDRHVNVEAKMDASLEQLHKESEIQAALGSVVSSFLTRTIDPDILPKVPETYKKRLKSMARLIASLRAQVERHSGYEKEIKYRASAELPTRVLKQLAKLGQMLCWVYDFAEWNEKVMKVLSRVTLNTCIGYHVDIIRCLVRVGNMGITPTQLVNETGINHAPTLSNRMADMEQLKLVYRIITVELGKKITHWFVTPSVVNLWNEANGLIEV